MPLYELIVEDTFDAAHELRGYQGPCERLHGHTYRVQVFLRVPEVGGSGISVDFREVKAHVRDVLDELDHRYLNDLPAFAVANPSAELIARHIYQALSPRLDNRVYKVTVWETPTSAAAYVEDPGE